MLKLGDLSIKAKLILMMTITTGISILFMAIIISVNEIIVKHASLKQELSTLARIIGSQSIGAIEFNDSIAAMEILNALSEKQNIIYAAIFLESDQVLAEYKFNLSTYVNSQKTPNRFLEMIQQLSIGKWEDTIKVSKAVFFEQQRIGEIQIISSLTHYYTNLVKYFCWVGFIVLACFSLGLTVSYRLHKMISEPILKLNSATKKVSNEGAYWLRIANTRNDELGLLIDSFNHMLEQIELRNQQLADYNIRLEAQVEDRTKELVQANEQRIQWLENMAGFLKHELKNSTIGIKSSLELIERRAQEYSIDVYLHRAKKSLSFMTVLLDNISHASSIEATVYKESLYCLDLTAFIKAQINEYQSFYPQYCLIEDCDSDIVILGNEIRLKQLLDKLLGNAFEHSYSNTPIFINARKKAGWVELSVINEGNKLPTDKDHIFDLFVSLRDSEHSRNDSLGLGLYLVKLITEFHSGSVIAIDREDKNGAIFKVKIPLIKD